MNLKLHFKKSIQPVWIALFVAFICTTCSAAPAFVWLEGESAKTSFPIKPGGTGRPHFLSESNWLNISVEEEKVENTLPEVGILLNYPFQIIHAGKYEIWNRIGFEFARSPFEWRLDNAPWNVVSPNDLTIDLMELATWTEVAWIKMGEQDIATGNHQLEIRLPKQKNAQGKWQRVLYASDALLINEGPFKPNSKYKPDTLGRDAADEQAAKAAFKLPSTPPSQRASVKLNGTWEIARDDEQAPGEVAEPIQSLPTNAIWRAIQVPGDKNKLREDLIFAHRVWYRTKIEIDASMAGRAFYLDFPYNNLNTTLFVNGVYCGFEKNPFVPFQIDVTRGIKPGQVNEIWVGIRDAWYGHSADPKRPMKLRKSFNLPPHLFSESFQDMDYPVWNSAQSGILATPSLIAAGGPVYTTDVFIKPSVAAKRLDVEVLLSNTSTRDAEGFIQWEAINVASGNVEHSFKAQPFKVAAGQSNRVDLSDAWSNPKLWWPDTPNLYRLRTSLVLQDKTVDVKETEFGFREWKREGTQFTLNGVVWHMWADLVGEYRSPQDWLAAYKSTNQRTTRLSTAGQSGPDSHWLGMEPQDALAFCDQNGVVVRRNTTLDGEKIGYQFSEGDPETKKQQGGSELKLALMKNWRDQCVAQVRAERNHPSIHIWSLENEFAYINLINLLGNSPNMDRYEEEITKTYQAVRAIDPTRESMVDGGGAMKLNTIGVQGDHYLATLDSRYPDLAYEPFVEGGGRGRWKWDQQRPRFIGEDFYASGINPADYAMWGGEVAFQGKGATRNAMAICYRMLTEGYRWGGYYSAWHFWLGNDGGEAQWGANNPRAALVREWDWTHGSGQKVARTYGIFNDTQYSDPITFTRQFMMGGKEVFAKTSAHKVPPGGVEKFSEELPMPEVSNRQEGELMLTLQVAGKEIYRDKKAISILPTPKLSQLSTTSLAVFDPQGGTSSYLTSQKVPFVPLNSMDSLPTAAKVLIVGKDAIQVNETTSTRLAAYASQGHAVIVLDQVNPLRYQAIPAEMELARRSKKNDFGMEIPTAEGRTAFIEDAAHPALAGLQDKDFFTWGPGQPLFHDAYVKPTRGGKSLMQCGPRLEFSALVEVPVGKGVLYLSQLDIGSRLNTHPIAQQLLLNMVKCASDYKLEFSDVTSVTSDASLNNAISAIGLKSTRSADPIAAIGEVKITLVSATSENLKLLAANLPKLQAFWQRGGNLVLFGLTPDGLSDYNQIVGVNHSIRPFARERVTFPAVRNPLTSGLTTGDIVMLSGQRLFGWTADEFVASDVFKYVVDLDDIAPFAKSDFANYGNIVNGFVGSDGWPLVIDFEYPKDGKPFSINMDLPREETIIEYTHDASLNYNATTKIALLFDGKDRVEYDMQPNGDAQTFAVNPPRKAKKVTLQVAGWLSDPAKKPLVGIDNINLKVQRSPEWKATVKPMLNNGGLVHYVKGNGGVILCNLNFQETEAVPINKTKKRAMLATILRNLKAPFNGGKTVIVGAGLTSTPIDIHTKATTYKDERGWFGDKQRTLKALPPGEHDFAGVKYSIYEYATSPVPQILMLGGKGVPGNLPTEINGIPVNVKADALFLLHAARIDQRMNDRERDDKKKFELCKYVVHYADGQTAEIPIYSEWDIDHFQQKEPKALPGAQIAWTSKFEGSEESAVVYAKQWNNPRPAEQITSVDLVYGKDKDRGVLALIAISAVTAK